MATNVKRLYVGQPTTSGTDLYTVPSGKKTIIKNIVITNVSDEDAGITLYCVPNGSSPNLTNAIIQSYLVLAYDTMIIDMSIVLESLDKIHSAQTTDSSITLYISGVEIS